jgi:tRNA-dihydrouridine synthase
MNLTPAPCPNALCNRPDYKKLGVLKQSFPKVPLIALTATATSRVADDLLTILRIEGCETFRNSVNRPNLFYEVRFLPGIGRSEPPGAARFTRIHRHSEQRNSWKRRSIGNAFCDSWDRLMSHWALFIRGPMEWRGRGCGFGC